MNLHQIFSQIPRLESPRLLLREITLSDANDIWEVYRDEEVGKYNAWTPVRTINAAKDKVTLFRKQFEMQERVRWGIELKAEGVLTGDCAFVHFDTRSDRAEIGFNLARKYWRKGIMTEALALLLPYAFRKLAINRIEAVVMPENIPSQKALEKSGFRKEAVLKEFGCVSGKYVDLCMYALLRREWEAHGDPG